VSQRVPVALAHKEIPGINRNRKRRVAQSKVLVVHGALHRCHCDYIMHGLNDDEHA